MWYRRHFTSDCRNKCKRHAQLSAFLRYTIDDNKPQCSYLDNVLREILKYAHTSREHIHFSGIPHSSLQRAVAMASTWYLSQYQVGGNFGRRTFCFLTSNLCIIVRAVDTAQLSLLAASAVQIPQSGIVSVISSLGKGFSTSSGYLSPGNFNKRMPPAPINFFGK